MTATPWMKFYPQDWRSDEKLRLCSLAARGLWIEMLAIMHRSERYGQLMIGGKAPTEAQLAVQVGTSPQDVQALLSELESAEVFSRTGSGVIYSRRMTRDYKKAQNARKNGKKGGNPKLSNNTGNPGWDNPEDKGGDKPQKPEARTLTNVSGGEPPDPIKELFDIGVGIFTATGSTDKQARSLVGRLRSQYGDGEAMRRLVECRTRSVSNPIEYIQKMGGSDNSALYAAAKRFGSTQ